MAKYILITGCNGFVGSNLVKYLHSKKYKINCIERNFDKNKIEGMVKNSNVIIHLAAIINPFDKDIWNINVNYTKFLVEMTKKYNRNFIYLSTQNVLFGKDNYSRTKFQAENIVRTLKDFVILRPTIIYGKNESRYIGKLIKIIKKSPVIPILGSGKYKLQPIHIGDLIKIIEYCIKNKIRGIFLVAGKSRIAYNELIDLIIKKLRLKRMKLYMPIFFIRPFAYLFQNLLKNPPVTTVQLDNIKVDQVYDTNIIEKTFNIKLKNIEDGIDLLIK